MSLGGWFSCTDKDDQTGNCRDCEKIPQLPTPPLPPSDVVGIRNNQTGTSSEHSRTSSSAGRCQPPNCDTPRPPVSQAGNATHHTTADASKHLAAILCPMVVIGILAVIILLCIRRPGDEACFKQALKFCNKGVREASPNKTKEPTHQHCARETQPRIKHQTVDPPPFTAANMDARQSFNLEFCRDDALKSMGD
ncbi:uncharacterized protein si:dkey-260g12.1 isoform X3 [Salvelinus sp. IW2-2015]|uniref:uncharacterized protein si:dkey-260g12.1 isoform X3 n=1 Tax=Salvelinus sp. IW2-2015 TaxID=2691554 RepID=UPI000CEA84E7|nr:uncharacterized protein LOC111978406 isoform X3 [Salvelinus alpinus]